ncbi:CoA-transferase family III [Gymnopilus junonius]|uniref:CoA-transferase family III n=1 Tax=Gymnopilus junonius TaxID=109634 RepID=A0A9P5NUD2_GYMJU|nr:CoA-transferase family III [Gymnopilus junonius]
MVDSRILQDMAETSEIPSELRSIWTSNGLPEGFLQHLKLTGNPDTAIPSSFKLGLAAQISIGLAALSAAYVHYLRTGVEQDVTVNARHAVLAFHSEAWYTINDSPPEGEIWDTVAGLYQNKGGEYVRIHTNFPHHRSGVLQVLSIPDHPIRATRADVSKALANWDAEEFEDACGKRGMCVFKLRTLEEWNETPQGKALKGAKVVDVRKVGEAGKKTYSHPELEGIKRPLQGVKMLDLSRVLAGPVAGRALAAQGAQVLLITSPNLPALPLLDTETSLGKRTTQLDLNSPSDKEKLGGLVRGADVFLQAYRPKGVEGKGFGVEDVIKIKSGAEGVVYASLRAWGWDGSWSDRRGFDSLVQTATGFNYDEGKEYQSFLLAQGQGDAKWAPRPLPMQALDHAAGYFLAFGINVGIAKSITEGGSHEIRVSLAAVGQWIRSLGRHSPLEAFGPESKPFPKRRSFPLDPEVEALSVEWEERKGGSAKGEKRKRRRMMALRQAGVLSLTPLREGVLSACEDGEDADWGAPIRLNADEPVWI